MRYYKVNGVIDRETVIKNSNSIMHLGHHHYLDLKQYKGTFNCTPLMLEKMSVAYLLVIAACVHPILAATGIGK